MSAIRPLPAPAEGSPMERMKALRALLAEKYPEADARPAGIFRTGLAGIDEAEGGLRRGSVTELAGPVSAGSLVIAALLLAIREQMTFGALIDAGASFDPQSAEPSALPRLLWVRCAEAMQAVKAADLLLRDGNLPLIVLDLQYLPLREARRVPTSTWHRFQRLAEPGGTAMLILSTQPIVEGAPVRIAMRQRWTLQAMRSRRSQLLQRVEAQVFTRRQFAQQPEAERRHNIA